MVNECEYDDELEFVSLCDNTVYCKVTYAIANANG
ncbi:hypothetical protein HMPREF9455_01378 [Dysgonomonas gadei ATCC BAA-286]|uniref:Uncharacterized protein n=1 Tax=Dysgonomonas gadei ATCC BAA-286 TaxID=742766 RepID=F5IWB1_9BACT|nr:hypothetical protein HMPREF9455_01378 [Dysgonomonas gadei ATCC BAA-286]